MKRARREAPPLPAKDGSTVRELLHPDRHGHGGRQSLAEATVAPGGATVLHRHRESEEVYHFTRGRGRMRLGQARLEVAAGDTVFIPPGTPHALENPGPEPLVLLCLCTPPYRDEDTEVLAAG